MKKVLKISLIILGVLMGIILIDTLQAKILNNNPILKIRENFNSESTDYIDRGLFVNHYKCNNNEKITVWKTTKYTCPINLEKLNNSGTFIRTYEVLNIAESNYYEYLYLTLRAFQDEEVVTVRVLRALNPNIKEDNNYEFTFKNVNKEMSEDIKTIFDNAELIKIQKTDRVGLDAIMDSVR